MFRLGAHTQPTIPWLTSRDSPGSSSGTQHPSPSNRSVSPVVEKSDVRAWGTSSRASNMLQVFDDVLNPLDSIECVSGWLTSGKSCDRCLLQDSPSSRH